MKRELSKTDIVLRQADFIEILIRMSRAYSLSDTDENKRATKNFLYQAIHTIEKNNFLFDRLRFLRALKEKAKDRASYFFHRSC